MQDDRFVAGHLLAALLIHLVVEPAHVRAGHADLVGRGEGGDELAADVHGTHAVFAVDVVRWQFVVQDEVHRRAGECCEVLIVREELTCRRAGHAGNPVGTLPHGVDGYTFKVRYFSE